MTVHELMELLKDMPDDHIIYVGKGMGPAGGITIEHPYVILETANDPL